MLNTPDKCGRLWYSVGHRHSFMNIRERSRIMLVGLGQLQCYNDICPGNICPGENLICTGYICLLRFWECLIDTFTRRNFPPKGMNKLGWAVLSLSFGWLTLNRWEGVLESLILDKEKRTFSSLNICWVRVNWGQRNFWMLPWKLIMGYKSNFVNI